MIKRLRIKFICITMVIVTVMMSALLIGQVNSTRESLIQRNMKALEDATWEYRQLLPDNREPGREKSQPDKPNFIKPERDTPCFILYLDSAGSLIAAGSGYYDLSDQALLLDVYQRAADRDRSVGALWNYKLQFLRTEAQGQLIYAFTDISGDVETMGEMTRNSMTIWILGFLGFLILSIFLANWAIRPVERAWEQQRQFVADASHELKTPLTVILTNAEMLGEMVQSDEQRQFSDSIVTMSHQMRGLVENMLQLARADSGLTSGEWTRVDCSALLEQTILPFESMYFEAGLTLEIDIQPGIMLTCNTVQLRRVAEILLDNALKYATPGGTVRVKLESKGHHCCLSVASPGETLTQRQCRDIFKRFYRVDPARHRNGSYGLGLAIAERVVADHRGKIWAEGKDGINTFYVNLPVG